MERIGRIPDQIGFEGIAMKANTWEAPGKGPWEIESAHFSRPLSRFVQRPYTEGAKRGFRAGAARYGLLLDHLDWQVVNGFMYLQPVAVGAPKGAMGPPPKPVLWLLARVHPQLRARIELSGRAFAERRWRAELQHWDDVDKPAAIAAHQAIQAVDVTALSDAELADHLDRCQDHLTKMLYLHHNLTVPSTIAVGDLLAGATEWADVSAGEVLGALQGTSSVSRGFAAEELEAAGKAITASDDARAQLSGSGSPESALETLCTDRDAGAQVRAYLDAVRYRSVGYDPADANAGELPGMLVRTLRVAVDGRYANKSAADGLPRLRAKIPDRHLDEFDDRLAEARLTNRLRDERSAYSDAWATGLARRALLEAGRRLHSRGCLGAADHGAHLDAAECRSLLLDGRGPDSNEVAARVAWRRTQTVDNAPPVLRAKPAPPPEVGVLPTAARRPASAFNAVYAHIFNVPEVPNSDTVLRGLPVNTGVYEGPARVVHDSADFDRVQRGDVLVTRMTSPHFTVVLPLLGAIVTDRGGQLSHAAIVAREYGIPGIVGTREATAKIVDGARVRVDGSSGEVRLLV
jgi:pyruvate,water dikinase